VAGAQTTCPPPDLQPLQQPPEIDAQGGVLSTTFVVKMQEHPCVPVFDGTKWTTQPMTLRTYFYPSAPGSSQLTWSTPGAMLRVRRATTPTSGDGDALKILLVNQLPAPSIPDSQCDAACPSGSNCCPAPGQPCPSTCNKGCPQETFPECFHGDNTTNLHFHRPLLGLAEGHGLVDAARVELLAIDVEGVRLDAGHPRHAEEDAGC
jgi:hypothetical protein